MNREDIIKLAREAGWKDLREFDYEMQNDIFMGKTQDLERFAALVAAASAASEREECAKLAEQKLWAGGIVAKAIRARGGAT